MIELGVILKPATQKNKLVFGCLLCKRNYPHVHEETPPTPVVEKSVNKTRTLLLMQDLQRIFFPNYRGRWYTVRPIHDTRKT